MATASEILKQIKENDVKFVDLRFTDPKGKLQHVTMDVVCVDEDMFADGVMFDGSSIGGWKAINESDMVLMPDTGNGSYGPVLRAVHHGHSLRHSRSGFRQKPTTAIRAAPPRRRRPISRHPASATPSSLVPKPNSSSSTTFATRPTLQHRLQARLDGTAVERRHRIRNRQPWSPSPRQGRLLPVPPIDSCQDMRSEMLTVSVRNGRRRRKASPRSGCRPARARHQVRHARAQRRQDADLQVRGAPGRKCLRQDGNLHAEADLRRQRLGHARTPVDLEGRQANLRRRRIRWPV